MIDGLKLKVPHSELREHCIGRSKYHQERAELKKAELPKVAEAMDAIKNTGDGNTVITMSKSGYKTEDPVQDLKDDIRDHEKKAMVFQYFADHLFEEDYNLGEEDLRRLEILKPRGW